VFLLIIVLIIVLIASTKLDAESVSPASVRHARQILDDSRKNPNSIVPDGIMNRTKCVVILPAGVERQTATGLVSCRTESDEWTEPQGVHLSGSPRFRSQAADVLVFILTDQGVRALGSKGLRLGTLPESGPGVLRFSKPAAAAKIRFDSLVYERRAGQLVGTRVNAVVRSDHKVEVQGPARSDVSARTPLVKSLTSYFNTIVPEGIIIHHSGIIPSNAKVPANVKQVDRFHEARGMSILCSGKVYHVAYHYLILPNGNIKRGRPERCQGAHATGYNSYLGISLVGDFSTADNPHGEKGLPAPTQKQMASLAKLTKQLMSRYRIPVTRVLRHSDVSSTQCPGDRFPFLAFRRMLRSGFLHS
jgi:hypothetical protein